MGNKNPGFISDEEVAQMEKSSGFISDEEFKQLEGKGFVQSAKDFGMDALHTVGKVIDRAGPAQIRNALAGTIGLKDESFQSFADDFTGNNAPSWADIANKAGLPKMDIDFQANSENLKDFKTTPSLSNDEQEQLKNTKTGFDTTDALGLGLDFAIGNKSANHLTKYAGEAVKAGGRILDKGFKTIANNVSIPVKKVNADDIIKAADQLGIKVTPGMLDDSGYVERLEYTLANSPSFLGQSVARDLKAVRDGLAKSGESLLDDASDLSSFDLGNEFKAGLSQKVHERLDPISSAFDDVAESTKNIPLSEKSLAAVQRNANNLDDMQVGVGTSRAREYIDAIPKLKNANQVKTLMTKISADLRSPSIDGAEKQALFAVKEKLANLEKNSIMRAAIQQSKDAGYGLKTAEGARDTVENVGKSHGSDIIRQLKDARNGYRELATDLGGIAKESRISSSGSPGEFLGKVEALPSENISQTFGTWRNNRALVSLQEKFPEQFELLRQGKLAELAKAAENTAANAQGGFNSHKFLKQVNSLEPEAQKLLFGDGMKTVENMSTVKNSIPRDFNPSHTDAQSLWSKDALMQNVKDIPNYLLYKGASSNLAQKVGSSLVKSPQMLNLQNSNPAAFEKLVSGIMKTGVVEEKLSPEADKPKIDKEDILRRLQGTKYGDVMKNAAAKGEQSFNAANFVLSQRDPDYRKHLEGN